MRETQLLTLFLQRLRILMQSSHTRDSDVNESGSANKKEAKAREKHAKEKESLKISQQKGRKGRTVWTVSILDEFFQVICDARVDVLALIKFDWTIFINPKGHDVR